MTGSAKAESPPRMLLLTNEPPQSSGAGSIVFHRLLREYPAAALHVITNRPPVPGAIRLPCRYEQLPLLADRLNRTRFWPWRSALRALGASGFSSLQRVDRRLAGFRPDIVVTLMQDSWMYDLAARYARERGLPLALFVHDLPEIFEPVPDNLRARQRARDAGVYRQAAVRFCISDGMARHFGAEFGAPGAVLLPPRSESLRAAPFTSGLKHPGRLTLGYAGGLHYGYGEMLRAMLPALRATGTTVEAFSPAPDGLLQELARATDVFRFHPVAATPEAAWEALGSRCDAILQPYLNPPGAHALQYRTHFPSKLGDCLASGLPLVITGPPDASGVAWCGRHPGSALIVKDPSPAALVSALERLRDDETLRARLAEGASAASGAFDPAPLRRKMMSALNTLRPAA